MAFPPLPDLRSENWYSWGDAVHTAVTAVFNVKNYGAIGNGTADDTAALQATITDAVNAGGGTVLIPNGNYKINGSVTLGADLEIVGLGWPTITQVSASAPTFVWQAPNGTLAPQAPHFRGLRFTGRNGIQLNSVAGGFTDDSTTQHFLMRPVIEDCEFNSDVSGSGIGVQFSKCFDYNIRRCVFGSFSVNLDLHGCDIGTVDNNRFNGGTVAQIRLTSYGTFGSSANISRNDMLDLNTGSYILSSDFDLRVRDNFFESASHVINSVIKTTAGYALRVTGNRVDVSSSIAPNWIDVGQPVTLCEITGNHTTGNTWGPAKFPTGGALYWYSGSQRQQIIHHGNSSSAGIPINSRDYVPSDPNVAWLWTPDLPGLTTDNYGLTARVSSENALVLPQSAGFGSLVRWATGVSGLITSDFLAKGGQAGQILNVQARHGTTVQWTDTYTLTTSYAKYELTTGPESHTDFQILMWVDTGTSASIKSMVVRW